ncbi:MAG: kynureninase [Comamonadaceae bacterium]|jgi:kynureninase|uniref:Kynureninase n=1 Tax=Hydrogenophaga borbori TaxID=2294117 RepID=A0A372EII5_9BURK|nr:MULTISPECIES: kynureninase [Hydrogenophaga]NCT98880.1 kynureninase [Comamonadaceae bacterium]RFP78331.1 kynureninase [Hydrogenophaga borbori]WQB82473.1 kynureninase [Hydrogenophaga sp. SNF1]
MTTTRQDCRALDAKDPLRALRDLFDIPADTIYLDGNSLGAMPRSAPARVAEVVTREWGRDLIRSWNSAGWFEMPRKVGDQIARLIGAAPGTTIATDSTSVNLFKALSAAQRISAETRPGRWRIVSERSNFPTDLYIAEALCKDKGWELVLVEPHEIAEALKDEKLAILMLTHVNYRTGAMHDMAAITQAAHAAGALVVWDLAHSAGAVPVDLSGADADFAVGCGYKYLNGGPGAPAFVWVNPRHAERCWQPLAGWWGHDKPFAFTPDYQPAPGIVRYQCGTQPMISLAALECGVATVLAAEPLGGMAALRRKSLALTDLFIALVEERCAGHGLSLVTPREHARRGSQVCLSITVSPPAPPLRGSLPPEGAPTGLGRPGAGGEGAYAIVQALIARGVIGDYRAGDGAGHPDILRFGFTPLYLGFEDVWNAVEHLREVLQSGEWQRPEFNRQHAVT